MVLLLLTLRAIKRALQRRRRRRKRRRSSSWWGPGLTSFTVTSSRTVPKARRSHAHPRLPVLPILLSVPSLHRWMQFSDRKKKMQQMDRFPIRSFLGLLGMSSAAKRISRTEQDGESRCRLPIADQVRMVRSVWRKMKENCRPCLDLGSSRTKESETRFEISRFPTLRSLAESLFFSDSPESPLRRHSINERESRSDTTTSRDLDPSFARIFPNESMRVFSTILVRCRQDDDSREIIAATLRQPRVFPAAEIAMRILRLQILRFGTVLQKCHTITGMT